MKAVKKFLAVVCVVLAALAFVAMLYHGIKTPAAIKGGSFSVGPGIWIHYDPTPEMVAALTPEEWAEGKRHDRMVKRLAIPFFAFGALAVVLFFLIVSEDERKAALPPPPSEDGAENA